VQSLRIGHLEGKSGVRLGSGNTLYTTLDKGYRYVGMTLANGETCGIYYLRHILFVRQ